MSPHTKQRIAFLLALILAAAPGIARADETNAEVRARGHHKKVIGAALIITGSFLDAATTAMTFTGLARGGWSLTPRSSVDEGLLYGGVVGGLVLDSVLTAGIVIYCDGGALMRKANQQR